MRKCFLSIMMALALALSLFPASALAAGDPPAGTEEANYVTLELKYGNHVDADIQSAAKAIYEGKTYASGAAAKSVPVHSMAADVRIAAILNIWFNLPFNFSPCYHRIHAKAMVVVSNLLPFWISCKFETVFSQKTCACNAARLPVQ